MRAFYAYHNPKSLISPVSHPTPNPTSAHNFPNPPNYPLISFIGYLLTADVTLCSCWGSDANTCF
ncbi:hypothetical protein, partial [Xenorhabdus bovienii]|uniref:hypothetical protein n=1 Tax=Xenorhabdus bovienii TaxID=40576 RepID=UPI001E62D6C9